MEWSFSPERPIYIQIMEHIQLDIVGGKYNKGEKIPSVRELASAASVNPNTMQKALSYLEDDGIISVKRNTGRYVTEDDMILSKIKEKLAIAYTRDYIDKTGRLGFQKDEIVELINKNAEVMKYDTDS